jgi:ADP-heptose:LPS heptosyltransferase
MLAFDPESIHRIAVLRANGLGDFLFATPALRALAKAFPQATITYLGLPWLRPFVEGRYPYINDVWTVPPYDGIRRSPDPPEVAAAETDRFFRACQAAPFDLAIQMHGGGVQSNPFLLRLGARHTLGLTGRGVTPLERNLRYQFYQPEVMRYLELVAQIGVPSDGWQMDAPERPGDEDRLRAVWPDLPAGAVIVLNPGASDLRRRWPIERFAAIADHIAASGTGVVAVTGALTERALAQQLRRLTRVPVVDLVGQLDLGATVALLRRSRLVVSNDTGLSNLAFAVNVPSVVIYWCGNVITAGPFTRRQFRPVLSWTLTCPSCGKTRCRCPVSFVQDATLTEVLEQVDDLLEVQTPSGLGVATAA